MKKEGTIKVNGMEIFYSGTLCKSEPNNGIMGNYIELENLKLLKGDAFDLLEFADSCKGYSIEVIEGKIMEQIENY